MQYQIHIREQHAKTGRSGRKGPDTYVIVTVALNANTLDRRGIELRFFGEGYRAYTGFRSSLGQAIRAAKQFVELRKLGDSVDEFVTIASQM